MVLLRSCPNLAASVGEAPRELVPIREIARRTGLSRNTIRTKVQNESVIFMTDRVATILERRTGVADGKFVFSNGNGKARRYSAIAIRKAFRRAGLHDCTIHTLRHTHATRLIQNGLNVYEVKTVLGHSDIKTTMRYAHLEQAVVTQRARDVIERLNAR